MTTLVNSFIQLEQTCSFNCFDVLYSELASIEMHFIMLLLLFCVLFQLFVVIPGWGLCTSSSLYWVSLSPLLPTWSCSGTVMLNFTWINKVWHYYESLILTFDLCDTWFAWILPNKQSPTLLWFPFSNLWPSWYLTLIHLCSVILGL